jgi:hypothetical protein
MLFRNGFSEKRCLRKNAVDTKKIIETMFLPL